MGLAELLLVLVGCYMATGFLFAVPFLLWGVHKIDPGTEGAGATFRLLILPGTALFWPLLALRWWRGQAAPVERNPHRNRAQDRENQ